MASDDEETGAAVVRWAGVSERLAAIGDVELAILKNHLVLEDVLKSVLARRLGLPEGAFSDLRIEFPVLLEIALAGVDKPHLVGALRALNGARNHVSHRVESREVSDKMTVFMQEVGRQLGVSMTWPGDRDGQLSALHHASGEAALELFRVVLR